MIFKYKVILATIIIIVMAIILVGLFYSIINMYHEYMNGKRIIKYLDDAEKACRERLKNDKQR